MEIPIIASAYHQQMLTLFCQAVMTELQESKVSKRYIARLSISMGQIDTWQFQRRHMIFYPMGSSEMSGAWHDEKLWMKLAVALQWIHESNVKIIRKEWGESSYLYKSIHDQKWSFLDVFSVESWTFYDAPLVLFPPVVAALPPLPPPLPPHSLDKERGTSVVKQNHPVTTKAWLNICFPLWLTSLTFIMKLPRLLVWPVESLSLAQRLARLDTKGLKYHPHGSNDAATTFDRNKAPVGRRQENHWESRNVAKMSPKCCRLYFMKIVCCGICMYIFFFQKMGVWSVSVPNVVWNSSSAFGCLQEWGRIILEGSSFTGLPSGSSWARDKPPPVTWLPATVGTLCRQNAKWGASVFSMLSMLTHIRSLHADW